ncbi:MAG: MerR family transcriptional regulator [Clostridia bacterium]|nr:MerR family transcriptional regulator [Clostridia bacterium]NLS86138.1 MerR family transcriptional regulator [Oscillospiraceae bacterium]
MTYTIGKAAQMINLNAPTLRFYDKEGLLPFVERSEGGIRLFKETDFEWLRLIECLKATGMPIKDIKTFIGWCMEGDATLEKRREMFCERKAAVEQQMKEMQDTLDIVTYKCWFYENAVRLGSNEKAKELLETAMPAEMQARKEKLTAWCCR